MKIHEKCEIADLILEILENDQKIEITGDNPKNSISTVSPSIVTSRREITGPVLIEVLRAGVDAIRRERGEPSRAEEFAAFVESDRLHAEAEPVNIGPGACCGCGFTGYLELTRPFIGRVCWQTGKLAFPSYAGTVFPKADEIARCPSCGKSYTFGPP